MKKITAIILLVLVCISFSACFGPKNYPGEAAFSWESEDGRIIFWFPAEAGLGKSEGQLRINDTEATDISLEWSGTKGKVEAKTASGALIFRADTVTDADSRTCLFKVTYKSGLFDIPDEISFHEKKN